MNWSEKNNFYNFELWITIFLFLDAANCLLRQFEKINVSLMNNTDTDIICSYEQILYKNGTDSAFNPAVLIVSFNISTV